MFARLHIDTRAPVGPDFVGRRCPTTRRVQPAGAMWTGTGAYRVYLHPLEGFDSVEAIGGRLHLAQPRLVGLLTRRPTMPRAAG
jgi:hypothetical protein